MVPSLRDSSKLLGMAIRLAERKGVRVTQAVELIEALVDDEAAHERGDAIAVFASNLLAVRSRRNAMIGAQIFRDPAWDMMLDLLVAAHQRRRVSAMSLCYASGAPSSTALRHIEHLCEIGSIERIPDPEDQRRTFIQATPVAIERMEWIVERMRKAVWGDPAAQPSSYNPRWLTGDLVDPEAARDEKGAPSTAC